MGLGVVTSHGYALKIIRREKGQADVPTAAAGTPMISHERLKQLRSCTPAGLDFKKLIRLCEEINTCYSARCLYAVMMLTRTVLDHVPPVFGLRNFVEVANNTAGGQSIKRALLHLEGVGRNVADSHLHTQMRGSETLPVSQQVNFGPDLDVLLAEVVRVTQSQPTTS